MRLFRRRGCVQSEFFSNNVFICREYQSCAMHVVTETEIFFYDFIITIYHSRFHWPYPTGTPGHHRPSPGVPGLLRPSPAFPGLHRPSSAVPGLPRTSAAVRGLPRPSPAVPGLPEHERVERSSSLESGIPTARSTFF